MRKPKGMPDHHWALAVYWATENNVPPELLAAIEKHETLYGTQGWGRPESGEYVLGYGCYSETQADPRFAGPEAQFRYASRQIGQFFEVNNLVFTEENWQRFSRESWKPGDPDLWAQRTWQYYLAIAREVAILDWAEKASAWVVALGISDGTRPDEPATRQEVWTMLYRIFHQKEV